MELHVLSRSRRPTAAAWPLLLALLLAGPAATAESPGRTVTFWEPGSIEERVEAIAASLNDAELLGQVFMLGYVGTAPSPELLRWIRERNLGGVKIFTRNVDSLGGLARSVAQMQQAAAASPRGIPLFVSTDQEGGWVRHVKAETSQTPGNLALGATGLPQDALLTGYYIGQELRALGINMNFAPTIDVYSNPSASVIGPRAFSSDPAQTALLALAYYRGLARSGVISTAKHYPGHGGADKDSHGALPVMASDFTQLWERDLLPYRILIGEGIPAVMSAHLAFPAVLGNLLPSSRSPFLMEEVLRRRMGFEGVVITDDMEMNGALSGGVDTAEACLQALEAGNDIVLISHSPRVQENTWQRLRRHLAEQPAFRQRLGVSVRRILRLKLQALDPPWAPAAAATGTNGQAVPIPAPGASSFFEQSALRAITLVRSQGLPLAAAPGARVLVVGQFEEFIEEARRRFPGADGLLFPFSPFYSARPEDLQSIPARAAAYDLVLFCLANYNSLEILETLRPLASRLAVVSALSPVYLRDTPWVRTAVAVYGSSRDSFRAGFAALAGEFRPEGRLPVDFLDAGGHQAAP